MSKPTATTHSSVYDILLKWERTESILRLPNLISLSIINLVLVFIFLLLCFYLPHIKYKNEQKSQQMYILSGVCLWLGNEYYSRTSRCISPCASVNQYLKGFLNKKF